MQLSKDSNPGAGISTQRFSNSNGIGGGSFLFVLARKYIIKVKEFTSLISHFLIDIVIIISKGSYSLLYSESFELVCFLSFLMKSKN